MKIFFLSFSDYKGGANIAAYSIFKSINKKNVEFLTLYSKKKASINIYNFFGKVYINFLRILEILIIKIFLKKKFHQSLNIFNSFLKKKIVKYKPNILNLHWINRATLSLNEINQLDCNIVISLHDMWFLNSTEHYFFKKTKNVDKISLYCSHKKKNLINKKNIFFIAHNTWMLNKFNTLYPKNESKIFLCKYYPIDTELFKPRNKIRLRKKYNLPLNKKIVLFTAQDVSDFRKGHKYFLEIVQKLKNDKNIFFLSIGKNFDKFSELSNFKHLDFMNHESVSEIYSLSDIYVCTSLIDNLPLTVLEAISSGNVVLSFKNGGVNEVLKNIGFTYGLNERNKLLLKLKNITTKQIRQKSIHSRKYAVQNFNKTKIANQYMNIFKKINSLN